MFEMYSMAGRVSSSQWIIIAMKSVPSGTFMAGQYKKGTTQLKFEKCAFFVHGSKVEIRRIYIRHTRGPSAMIRAFREIGGWV